MFKTSEAERKRKADSNARVKERDPEAWKQRRRGYVATYRRRHPDRIKKYDRQRNLKDKFGVTIEEYDALFSEQRGLCAICFNECPSGKRLAVDHDHDTGRIRALLCSLCNMALGHFETDDRLERAVEYLTRFK